MENVRVLIENYNNNHSCCPNSEVCFQLRITKVIRLTQFCDPVSLEKHLLETFSVCLS